MKSKNFWNDRSAFVAVLGLKQCAIALACFSSTVLCLSMLAYEAAATATSFVDPNGWTLGDPDSAFQEWDAEPSAPFAASGTLPSATNVNPLFDPNGNSEMGVVSPGFPAGSGGYYAFGGTYSVEADVLSHGGASGNGGPYPSGSGTRVIVQVGSTVSLDDISVFTDTLEIVNPNGAAIAGGENSSKLDMVQLAVTTGVFGGIVADLEQLLYEFYLPDYTDDYQVRFDVQQHSSFQHLRVDSLIQQPSTIDPDFDADGSVAGPDLLTWQQNPVGYGGADGLAAWDAAYGSSSTASAVTSVPEPNTMILLVSAIALGALRPTKNRPC